MNLTGIKVILKYLITFCLGLEWCKQSRLNLYIWVFSCDIFKSEECSSEDARLILCYNLSKLHSLMKTWQQDWLTSIHLTLFELKWADKSIINPPKKLWCLPVLRIYVYYISAVSTLHPFLHMKETQQEICKITGKVPENGKKFQWCQLCFEITNETNKMQLFLKTSSIRSSRHKQILC